MSSPGRSRRRNAWARAAAPARWLSIVTITTRMGVVSAAEVRFGIVQCLDCDDRETAGLCERLGVAAGHAAHEERNFLEFGFGVGRPERRRDGCLFFGFGRRR